MKRALGLVLCGALLLLPTLPARADDGRVGGEPGTVHVLASKHIRMEAETVQAVLYGEFAEYVVDFKFVNDGPAETVRLGFPFALDDKSIEPPGVSLAGFQAFKDGRPLDVTPTEGFDGESIIGWFEHTATLEPGTTMIRVSYVTRPRVMAGVSEEASNTTPPAYAGMVAATASYPYTLHTGAGWVGTIGRAVVRYMVSGDFQGWGLGVESGAEPWGTRPPGFEWPDPNTLQWILEDFEPLQEAGTGYSPFDINATYYWPGYVGYGGEVRPEWAKPPIANVQASSESPVTETDYPQQRKFLAENVRGDPADSWISAEGDSAGAWLHLTAGERREMRELRIVPGYARTAADYGEHGRPKRIEVSFDDGTVETFDLVDEPTVQRFPLSVTAQKVGIEIAEVYAGSEYDDVAVAAVELGSVAAPAFQTFEQVLAATGVPVDTATLVVDDPLVVTAEVDAKPPEEAPERSPALLLAAIGGVLVIGAAAVVVLGRRHSKQPS